MPDTQVSDLALSLAIRSRIASGEEPRKAIEAVVRGTRHEAYVRELFTKGGDRAEHEIR